MALLTGCKPGAYILGVNHDTPEEIARAAKLQAEADAAQELLAYTTELHGLDLDARQANAELQHEAAAQAIADERDSKMKRAEVERSILASVGESASAAIRALGYGLVVFEVLGGLFAVGVIAVDLWTRARKAPAQSRVLTLTTQYNGVNMSFVVYEDGAGKWQVIDPFGNVNLSRKETAQLRANMLQLTLENHPALPAPRMAATAAQQDGLLVRVRDSLFKRTKTSAEVIR